MKTYKEFMNSLEEEDLKDFKQKYKPSLKEAYWVSVPRKQNMQKLFLI